MTSSFLVIAATATADTATNSRKNKLENHINISSTTISSSLGNNNDYYNLSPKKYHRRVTTNSDASSSLINRKTGHVYSTTTRKMNGINDSPLGLENDYLIFEKNIRRPTYYYDYPEKPPPYFSYASLLFDPPKKSFDKREIKETVIIDKNNEQLLNLSSKSDVSTLQSTTPQKTTINTDTAIPVMRFPPIPDKIVESFFPTEDNKDRSIVEPFNLTEFLLTTTHPFNLEKSTTPASQIKQIIDRLQQADDGKINLNNTLTQQEFQQHLNYLDHYGDGLPRSRLIPSKNITIGGITGQKAGVKPLENQYVFTRYTLFETILIGFVAAFLTTLTIVGNIMVMISFRIDPQLQTVSNYFLMSLAVADMTIGIVSMPLYTIFVLMGYWPFGPFMCDLYLAIDYLMSNASVLNLLAISLDRYFSVTRPLTYRAKRTPKRAGIMIALAWIVSLLLWPPWIFAYPYIEGKRTVPPHDCYIQFIKSNPYLTMSTAIAAFYLPVTVMSILYWRVWRETQKRQKDLPYLQGDKNISKKSSSSDEGSSQRTRSKILAIDSSSRLGKDSANRALPLAAAAATTGGGGSTLRLMTAGSKNLPVPPTSSSKGSTWTYLITGLRNMWKGQITPRELCHDCWSRFVNCFSIIDKEVIETLDDDEDEEYEKGRIEEDEESEISMAPPYYKITTNHAVGGGGIIGGNRITGVGNSYDPSSRKPNTEKSVIDGSQTSLRRLKMLDKYNKGISFNKVLAGKTEYFGRLPSLKNNNNKRLPTSGMKEDLNYEIIKNDSSRPESSPPLIHNNVSSLHHVPGKTFVNQYSLRSATTTDESTEEGGGAVDDDTLTNTYTIIIKLPGEEGSMNGKLRNDDTLLNNTISSTSETSKPFPQTPSIKMIPNIITAKGGNITLNDKNIKTPLRYPEIFYRNLYVCSSPEEDYDDRDEEVTANNTTYKSVNKKRYEGKNMNDGLPEKERLLNDEDVKNSVDSMAASSHFYKIPVSFTKRAIFAKSSSTFLPNGTQSYETQPGEYDIINVSGIQQKRKTPEDQPTQTTSFTSNYQSDEHPSRQPNNLDHISVGTITASDLVFESTSTRTKSTTTHFWPQVHGSRQLIDSFEETSGSYSKYLATNHLQQHQNYQSQSFDAGREKIRPTPNNAFNIDYDNQGSLYTPSKLNIVIENRFTTTSTMPKFDASDEANVELYDGFDSSTYEYPDNLKIMNIVPRALSSSITSHNDSMELDFPDTFDKSDRATITSIDAKNAVRGEFSHEFKPSSIPVVPKVAQATISNINNHRKEYLAAHVINKKLTTKHDKFSHLNNFFKSCQNVSRETLTGNIISSKPRFSQRAAKRISLGSFKNMKLKGALKHQPKAPEVAEEENKTFKEKPLLSKYVSLPAYQDQNRRIVNENISEIPFNKAQSLDKSSTFSLAGGESLKPSDSVTTNYHYPYRKGFGPLSDRDDSSSMMTMAGGPAAAGSSLTIPISSYAALKSEKSRKRRIEKKQDRKAAKTLTAILLAFVITWTPYNICVIVGAFCLNCVPDALWAFSYYLCYINSTVNPVCYAMCNANFRRNFRRILACKFTLRKPKYKNPHNNQTAQQLQNVHIAKKLNKYK